MATRQLNARIPEELYQRVEQFADQNGTTKPQIVTNALQEYFDINDSKNDINLAEGDINSPTDDDINDNNDINLYELLIDEKEKRILFLEQEIGEKNTQIHKFQANQQLYLADRTGLIEKVARKLKLKK